MSYEEEEFALLINRKYLKHYDYNYDYIAGSSGSFESFYPKFIWSYVAETFLASLTLTKTSKKNPLFEVISLRGPTGPLSYQFF
jgi:hypothetical protein